MFAYHIEGGKELSGTVRVSGSKNASLPIICATLLTEEKCVLKNIPDISDVRNMIEILKDLGSQVSFENNILEIDNSKVNSYKPKEELVKKLRGSILLMGPLLARFKKVHMPFPGGDVIGKRPIDTHLLGFEDLGATVTLKEYLDVSADKLTGHEITLNEMSVTATENLIMAAAMAQGTTLIHLAATEPHIQDLCNCLNKMGAKISGIGTHDLSIEGVKELKGVEHSIIFDNEVACSFMNLAAATKSELTIDNIHPEYLRGALIQFRQMNVNFEVSENSVKIKKPNGPYKAAKINPNIYPGLLTDYVPPFAVLATQAEGQSLVHEWMYEGRLGYIHELSKMGAKTRIIDQHQAVIEGPCKLHGTNVSSLDVRSGMVLVIAALVAEGKSVLHDADHIQRGYEKIDEVLRGLGANIQKV